MIYYGKLVKIETRVDKEYYDLEDVKLLTENNIKKSFSADIDKHYPTVEKRLFQDTMNEYYIRNYVYADDDYISSEVYKKEKESTYIVFELNKRYKKEKEFTLGKVNKVSFQELIEKGLKEYGFSSPYCDKKRRKPKKHTQNILNKQSTVLKNRKSVYLNLEEVWKEYGYLQKEYIKIKNEIDSIPKYLDDDKITRKSTGWKTSTKKRKQWE